MGTLDRISLLLTERKISQKDLTDYLGVDKSTFSQWKKGTSQSYNKYLPSIAAFFGVSMGWLSGETRFRTKQELLECYNSWDLLYNEHLNAPYEFCGLLKELREEQDVTTEEMAKEIGLTTEQYKECEYGGDPISYEEAMKLCEYLGTTVKQVLFDHALYEPDYPVPPEWQNDIDGFEKMRQEAEDADRADYYAYASKTQNVSEPEDENLIILNRNAKKLSPENRKKLLDMARLMFKEEFNDGEES